MSTPTTPPENGGTSPAGTDTVVMVGGQDWEQVAAAAAEAQPGERIVVNMGPQHPSTHGVLRLILEIEGETITEARCGIGYLHTGIEKNLEYRNWTQGVTFVTRMDYLSPFFNETAYCLGVEKLLGVTDDIPERATVIRVMMMELNRISSHLVALATGGMELGAMSAMFYGFREREQILSVFETVTGLRMDSAYVRPGGLAADLPDEAIPQIRDLLELLPKRLQDLEDLLNENYIWKARTVVSATSIWPAAWRWASPDRCCALPGCRTTCAGPSRTVATRHTTSTSSPTTAAIPTAATSFGSRRCVSRSRSSSSA